MTKINRTKFPMGFAVGIFGNPSLLFRRSCREIVERYDAPLYAVAVKSADRGMK